jgi:DNA-directed RNA polymerase omega subunit
LPIEDIERRVGSRYALTVLAGLRARELRDGSPRLVIADSTNPILIALQEIHEGKIYAENLVLAGDAPAEEPAAQAAPPAEPKPAAEIAAAAVETEAPEAAEVIAISEEPAVEGDAPSAEASAEV